MTNDPSLLLSAVMRTEGKTTPKLELGVRRDESGGEVLFAGLHPPPAGGPSPLSLIAKVKDVRI